MSAGGRGLSGRGEGNCTRGVRGSPASPQGGCRRSAHTNNNKRKETRAAAVPALGPPRRRRGAGQGARRGQGGRAPYPGVPPPPPRTRPARGASEHSHCRPGTHPPSKSEMIPSSCALTAGSDMVARRQRDARRAAERKRPGRPGPCALAGAPRPRSRRAELAAEPLGPRARLNEWGRRAGAGLPLLAPPPRSAPASWADQVPAPWPGLPGSHWLLRPPVKAGTWGAGARATTTGQAESWALDLSAPLLPAQGRAVNEAGPLLHHPPTPHCGQMWADVQAGGRHGGGA